MDVDVILMCEYLSILVLEDEVHLRKCTELEEARVGECRTLRPIGKYLELILTRVSFNLRPRSCLGREVSCMMVSGSRQ